MHPPPPSTNGLYQFALVASPFQPALEETPIEAFIEGLIAGDEVSPKDLQTAFAACLSQLNKGSYYGYLACQILQYAANSFAGAWTLSDDQINQLKEYFTRNLTYQSTRAGEMLFGELTRSTAADFLLVINEIVRARTPFPSTRQNSADQHLPARELQMEL